MTLDEIKSAVDAGKKVHWINDLYEIIKDKHGQYLNVYRPWKDADCIGLTHADGVTLNGKEHEFYLGE